MYIQIENILKTPSAEFSIGERVTVDMKKKGWGGKSFRREILENLCAYWQSVKLTNDPKYGGEYFATDSVPYLLREKVCLGKLWDEKKEWIRVCLEVLDNIASAHVICINPSSMHSMSEYNAGHICYINGSYSQSQLLYYHVLVVDGKGRAFRIVTYSDNLKKLPAQPPKD